jgi:hypothetical protein
MSDTQVPISRNNIVYIINAIRLFRRREGFISITTSVGYTLLPLNTAEKLLIEEAFKMCIMAPFATFAFTQKTPFSSQDKRIKTFYSFTYTKENDHIKQHSEQEILANDVNGKLNKQYMIKGISTLNIPNNKDI